MGTRGAFGIVIDGETKATYNHFDSYPSELGSHILYAIRSLLAGAKNVEGVGIEGFKTLARNLRVVNDDDKPTPRDIEDLQQYANTGVSTGKLTEWYVLLHNLQGDLLETLKAGVLINGKDFLLDSLFCEYAYLVNLDTEKLEFYVGFQKTKPIRSRYQSDHPTDVSGYWPVELVAKLPFDHILSTTDADLVAELERLENPEDEDVSA